PVVAGEARGVDPRSGDDDHPELGDPLPRLRVRRRDAAEQVLAHARAADRHDADALVGPEPQSRAELLAIPEGGGVEPGDVAAERVVGVRPLADRGEPRTEGARDYVLRIADEHREIAKAREALDVLDHLGVVVG